MRRRHTALLAIALFAVSAAFAEAPDPGGSDTTALLLSMSGRWEGELEYRDYQSDERVTLPATRRAEASGLAPFLLQDLEFVDPDRRVRSHQMVTVDKAAGAVSIIVMTPEGPVRETFRVSATEIEDPMSAWTIVLERAGNDDNRPADIRVTQTLRDGTLRSRKEVRFHDDRDAGWQFRNETRFDRAKADPDVLVGKWQVDLRPTPDAEPYLKEMNVESIEDGKIRGFFYDTPIRDGHVNVHWGELRFAFVTEDSSGAYYTAGVVRGDRIEGTTHSLGRGFLNAWYAKRAE